MEDVAKAEVLEGDAPVPNPDTKDGGISAIIGTAAAIVGLINSIFSALNAANEANKLRKKWEQEGQGTCWWTYSDLRVRGVDGPLRITVHDVDDDANIWWNSQYLYTHSINDGPRRINANLRRGENVFFFELNNHGGHKYSLFALIEQNGRTLRHCRLSGDDAGKFHVATQRILVD